MTAPLSIAVHGVGYSWPNTGRMALDDVNFDSRPGELLGIIGPNGAGKSTILRLIAGLLRPSTGSIQVCGRDPARISRREAARDIAFVPASLHVGFPLNVRDLVALGRTPHLKGTFESAQDRVAIDEALALLELSSFVSRPYRELSAGEQRRVLVARSIAQAPRIMLLDEPSANLDAAQAVAVLSRVKELAQSRTMSVVMAIHDLNLAMLFCDRIVLVTGGRVRESGDPEEVMHYSAIRDAFGGEFYIGRNEINNRLFLVPMEVPKPSAK